MAFGIGGERLIHPIYNLTVDLKFNPQRDFSADSLGKSVGRAEDFARVMRFCYDRIDGYHLVFINDLGKAVLLSENERTQSRKFRKFDSSRWELPIVVATLDVDENYQGLLTLENAFRRGAQSDYTGKKEVPRLVYADGSKYNLCTSQGRIYVPSALPKFLKLMAKAEEAPRTA